MSSLCVASVTMLAVMLSIATAGVETEEIGTVMDDLESVKRVPETEKTDVDETAGFKNFVNGSLVTDEVKEQSSETNQTRNTLKQSSLKNHHKDPQNLPPISFRLQHPFLLSDVEEFVFSPWYFLVLSIVNSSSSLPADVTTISSDFYLVTSSLMLSLLE